MDSETPDEDKAEATVVLCGNEAHSGPGWYYYWTEYPDEGSVGAFRTRAAAVAHIEAEDGRVVEE